MNNNRVGGHLVYFEGQGTGQKQGIQDTPQHDQEFLERCVDSEQMVGKKDGKKQIVIQRLIEYAADRMAYLVRKHQINREISIMLYGATSKTSGIPKKNLHFSTFEKILHGARALMRQRSSMQQLDARDDSIAYWECMLTDPDVPWAIKARARENLDKLNCVSMPDVSLLVHAGQSGKQTVALKDLGLDLESKKQALEKLRAAKQVTSDVSNVVNAVTLDADDAALADALTH